MTQLIEAEARAVREADAAGGADQAREAGWKR